MGVTGTRAMTVSHEINAVTSLIAPASRYAGHQNRIASIRCVVPQARINAANNQKIPRNGISRRRQDEVAQHDGYGDVR